MLLNAARRSSTGHPRLRPRRGAGPPPCAASAGKTSRPWRAPLQWADITSVGHHCVGRHTPWVTSLRENHHRGGITTVGGSTSMGHHPVPRHLLRVDATPMGHHSSAAAAPPCGRHSRGASLRRTKLRSEVGTCPWDNPPVGTSLLWGQDITPRRQHAEGACNPRRGLRS